MLVTRILLGVPLFCAILGVLLLDAWMMPGWGVVILQALFGVLAIREYGRFAERNGFAPATRWSMFMLVVLFVVQEWHLQNPGVEGVWGRVNPVLLCGTVAVAGVMLVQLFRHRAQQAMANIGATLLGLVYCWFFMGFVGQMRHLTVRHGWEYDGLELVFGLFCVSKVSDIGGLLVGSRFGSHKLFPAVSPKKTWEGAIGGVLASVGLMAALMAMHPAGAFAAMGYGVLLPLAGLMGVVGLVGDLVESALKRDSNVKDAGRSLPGYGGVLDILDSLTLNAPLMYFYLVLLGGALPPA